MKKKVSIVTSGHPYYDERIFYKFARSLNKNGYEVSVICSTVETNIDLLKDDIHIIGFNGSILKKPEKVRKFSVHLTIIEPDIIICCEPLPILAANKLRKKNKNIKIIYDVTEWYPENVSLKLYGIKKYTSYPLLFIFNIFVSNLVDAIIIGERKKRNRYDLLAPFKPKHIVFYYPVLEFFTYSTPRSDKNEFVCCYAGLLKFDRGMKQILEAVKVISTHYKDLTVKLKLIGKFESSAEHEEFISLVNKSPELSVEIFGWVEYPKISEQLSDVHVCFDLREKNFVYRNSLPIKIFEYMACGKPFIFTDIEPIRNEIEFDKCGALVNPSNIKEIIKATETYLNNNELLITHSKNSRKLIEEKYNWEKESKKLLELVSSLCEPEHS